MIFSILSWIITETIGIGIASFTILTLSRINRKERAGWNFLKPNIYKSIFVSLFSMVFYSILIFVFDLPIYYRFYNKSVVIFYFFWKFLGFVLVFDRVYSKIWLEKKLRFQSLHSHGIEWSEHLIKLKNKIVRRFGDHIKHGKGKVCNLKVLRFLDENHHRLKADYQVLIDKYYDDVTAFVIYGYLN